MDGETDVSYESDEGVVYEVPGWPLLEEDSETEVDLFDIPGLNEEPDWRSDTEQEEYTTPRFPPMTVRCPKCIRKSLCFRNREVCDTDSDDESTPMKRLRLFA